MSSKDAVEYLYVILRWDRAQEQMTGEGFLNVEERRKIWEVIASLERYKAVPNIYDL